MQNRVNVKLWNLAALLLLLSLPLTTSPPISIAAEQDEVDIFMEGIPVYGTVSISATAGAGAWGSHGTFVEGRQGGGNPNRMADDTGNLVLQDTAAEHSDAASIDVTN